MSSHRDLIKPGRTHLVRGVCRDVMLTAGKGDDGRWSVWIDAAEHGRAGGMTRPEACAYIAGVLAGAQRAMQPALAAEAAAKARLEELQADVSDRLARATLAQLLDALAECATLDDWANIIDRFDLTDDALDAADSQTLRDILIKRGDYETAEDGFALIDATDALDDMRAGRKQRAHERVIEELERVARQ